jgi:hypothetical protein
MGRFSKVTWGGGEGLFELSAQEVYGPGAAREYLPRNRSNGQSLWMWRRVARQILARSSARIIPARDGKLSPDSLAP